MSGKGAGWVWGRVPGDLGDPEDSAAGVGIGILYAWKSFTKTL